MSDNNEFHISDQELEQFKIDLQNLIKNDTELQRELKSITKEKLSRRHRRGAIIRGAQKAIQVVGKWMNKNYMKIWNILPPGLRLYLSTVFDVSVFRESLGKYIGIWLGISKAIDDYIYNVVRDVLPRGYVNDTTVEKIAQTIRLLIPLPV